MASPDTETKTALKSEILFTVVRAAYKAVEALEAAGHAEAAKDLIIVAIDLDDEACDAQRIEQGEPVDD